MQTHYIDIKPHLATGFGDQEILGDLYGKLHLALVEIGTGELAVSFPQMGKVPGAPNTLGSVLRVLGTREALQELLAFDWLDDVEELVQVSQIAEVPAHAEPAILRRVRGKNAASLRRLIRRAVERGGMTQAQAEAHHANTDTPPLNAPSLSMLSLSTGQRFRMGFSLTPAPAAKPGDPGSFNAYGISVDATIALF